MSQQKQSFKTTCKDYTPPGGTLRKGCGQSIVMTIYPDGKYHPHNEDGSVHKHTAAPETPTTQTSQPGASKAPPLPRTSSGRGGLYDDIVEVKVIEDEKVANQALKSVEGWKLLSIKEKRIEVKALNGQPQVTQCPVFVFGKLREAPR